MLSQRNTVPKATADRSTFLQNEWYVEGTAHELCEKPIAQLICGEAIVLFRHSRGKVAALEDRCLHGKAPLSLGNAIGDEIQCGYHGARFKADGTCALIPSQQDVPVPKIFTARSYAVAEMHGLIFLWMGDAARADKTMIPDWSRNTAHGWAAVHGYHYVKGNYQLINDNLLDLSHTPFVHTATFAGPGVNETPMEMQMDGDIIRTGRTIRNTDPTPIHRKLGMSGKVDRYQWSDFMAPCYTLVNLSVEPPGATQTIRVPLFIAMNSATPETERTTHYFWSLARCRHIDDEELTQKYKRLVAEAFDEDQAMIEAQQRMIDNDNSDDPLAVFLGDRGAVAARRIIARKMKEEANSVKPTQQPGSALTKRVISPCPTS